MDRFDEDELIFTKPIKRKAKEEPVEEEDSEEEEKGQFLDNNYWRAPSLGGELNDLLQNYN